MIRQGCNGSINLFWRNKLIISRPMTTTRNIEWYEEAVQRTLVEALQAGWSLPRLSKFHLDFLKKCRYETMMKTPDSLDKDLMMVSGMTLIKLKVIDPDGDREGLLIMKSKGSSCLARHSAYK